MKWMLVAVGVLVLVAVVIVFVGALLPQNHTASRSADFKQQPEVLWEAITNIEAFPSWKPGLKSVERLPLKEGLQAWRETNTDGTMTYEVVQSDPQRRLVTKIADTGLPFGGTWTYEISASGSGSTVKLTENGEVYNVFFRFMSRFVFGHSATIESYLKALGRKFGETVEVK